VDVVGAQSAKDFVLPVKHEVFKPSNPRLISKALHYIRGLKVGMLLFPPSIISSSVIIPKNILQN
jgi:hypothetical protein